MLFSTVGQGWVFLWMVAAGALIACWYALLAALRRLLAAGFWLSLAADVAFGVGAAAIFCAALVAADYGRVRLFSVAGTLAGFALCAAGLFSPARRLAMALAGRFRRIFVKIRAYRWIKVIFK
ncbi:MAG: hypothetical protein IJ119_13765 [Clostridia bacterium]|nr:hypothetical protein [Clostridia bacterium]